MHPSAIDDITREMRGRGFTTKAFVDNEAFGRIVRLLDEQPERIDTPPDELRFIEGRLDLPMGHLDYFRITTADGRTACECGRTTTALDIVSTALVRRTHPYSLMRDALIGLRNTIEFAEKGRQGECYVCGRAVLASSYWTHSYLYA
jgi:hypothetical protein